MLLELRVYREAHGRGGVLAAAPALSRPSPELGDEHDGPLLSGRTLAARAASGARLSTCGARSSRERETARAARCSGPSGMKLAPRSSPPFLAARARSRRYAFETRHGACAFEFSLENAHGVDDPRELDELLQVGERERTFAPLSRNVPSL